MTHRDRISGIWEADTGDLIQLRSDGAGALTGSITIGGPGNRVAIQQGRFDATNGAMTLEGTARHPWNGSAVTWRIEGTLSESSFIVHYRFNDDTGQTTLTRVTPWYALRRRMLRGVTRWSRRVEPIVVPIARAINGLRRPSPAANARQLRARGESLDAIVIREPTAADIPALAMLHVVTWAATYPGVRQPPTFEIREWQWKEAFAKQDGSWCAFVAENPRGELVGFVKGTRDENHTGGVSKIYLLTEYQRLGLGRRLLEPVTRRLIDQGVTSMYVAAEATNPSCGFYEAMGAEHTRDQHGRMERGSYVWRDLPALLQRCRS